MTAHKVENKETGKVTWICDCGSKLEARYNLLNKLDCLDSERGCAWCFKNRGKK